MKTETKETIKKAATMGVSTAMGAAAGVMAGAAIMGNEAHAEDNISGEPEVISVDPEPTPAPAPQHQPQHQPQQPANHTEPEQPVTPAEPANNQTQTSHDEVEVLGYDRVTNEDGSQMDIAVVNVNGNEVGIVDVDLDGEADALVCDVNQNGVIEENEMQIVQGQGIAMEPLQEAAGFDPLYAQNDMPDYVNDANVDTYMA